MNVENTQDNVPRTQTYTHTQSHQSPTDPEDINIDIKQATIKSKFEKANFFSKLHYFFIARLVKLGLSRKRKIKLDDLDTLGTQESSQWLEKQFTAHFDHLSVKYNKKPIILLLIIIKLFKKEIIIMYISQFLNIASRILVTFFMFKMLASLRDPNQPTSTAYHYSIGIFLNFLLGMYTTHIFAYYGIYTTVRIRAGFTGLLFRKTHKLSLHGLHLLNPGMITNLVSNDINNIDKLPFLITGSLAPVMLVGGWGFTFYLWGWPSVIGLAYFLALIFMQFIFAARTFPMKRLKIVKTDKRIGLLIEAMEAIRQLKMYAWDVPYIDQVTHARSSEIYTLRKSYFYDTIPRSFTATCNYFGSFFIFLVYTQTIGPILVRYTFPTTLMATFMRSFGSLQIFNGFGIMFEFLGISLRTMTIMNLPEKGANMKIRLPKDEENDIEFDNFTGYWISSHIESCTANSHPAKSFKPSPLNLYIKSPPAAKPEEKKIQANHPSLYNINLNVKKGSLVTIIGPIKTGKSSLLLAPTGEMHESEGELRMRGTYSYLAQEPIIYYSSIKDSVCFDHAYNEALFWEVIEACCLTEEVRSFPKAHLTEIGEHGVVLSNSQKTRVSLARALYADSNIYLLDDPLSNVSLKMAKKLMKKAILGFLKKRNKTVLLTLRIVYLAKDSDAVVIMEEGKIVAHGPYEELISQEAEMKTFLGLSHVGRKIPQRSPSPFKKKADSPHRLKSMQTYSSFNEENVENNEVVDAGEMLEYARKSACNENLDVGLYLEDEKLDDGKVTFKIYWKLFTSMFNWITVFPSLALLVAAESPAWLYLIYLGNWARGEWSNTKGATVAGILSGAAILIQLPKCWLYYYVAMRATTRFHHKMVKGVILSPMNFFDRNPIGRIINRFSNDIAIVDRFLTPALLEFAEGVALFIVYFFTLWIKEVWILLPAGILLICYVIVYRLCYGSLNQVRNLELTTRGPIYSLFLIETRNLVTIRARRATEEVWRRFYEHVNLHLRANLAYNSTLRFMNFVLDYITQIVVIATFCFFIQRKDTPLTTGYFVNILTLLPSTMQWLLQGFNSLNLLMTSPARIINYIENYKPLKYYKNKDKEVEDSGWPQNGDIRVQNASLRYTTKSEPFLKNINFHIEPGQKIAIIGEDRSGMSSLVHLLVKTMEVDPKSDIPELASFVKIDDVNINDLGVHLIRKNLNIIPQGAYLFTHTIRRNIDPWRRYTDEQIWKALKDVCLKEYIEKLPNRLETHLSRGSSVFSVGQKQLLCLARGLLKDTKITIQDDCAQHVDIATHQVVERHLQKRFDNCTVVTMTHRILLAANNDKVIVMKEGQIMEFDEPYRLLVKEIGDEKITNRDGFFANYCLHMGSAVSKGVFEISRQRYYKRRDMPLPDRRRGSTVIAPEYESGKKMDVLKKVDNHIFMSHFLEKEDVGSRENLDSDKKRQ